MTQTQSFSALCFRGPKFFFYFNFFFIYFFFSNRQIENLQNRFSHFSHFSLWNLFWFFSAQSVLFSAPVWSILFICKFWILSSCFFTACTAAWVWMLVIDSFSVPRIAPTIHFPSDYTTRSTEWYKTFPLLTCVSPAHSKWCSQIELLSWRAPSPSLPPPDSTDPCTLH